jgi:exonuclease III
MIAMNGQKYRLSLFFILFAFIACDDDKTHNIEEEEFDEIKIMTFNVLYPTSNEASLQALLETDADIIGLQEISTSRLMELAQQLHYHFHSFSKTDGNLNDQDTGILSRFPFTRYSQNGVVVRVNPNLEVGIFTVHLAPYPYQPYDFRDGIIHTTDEAIEAAAETRIPSIESVLEEVADVTSDGIPVFLTGDFNEPSFLDWTAQTAASNLHFGKIVEWPVSKAITQSGFIDSYRSKFSNPADFPGITWTTVETENEVYDRIDMIYHTANTKYEIKDVRLVGGPDDSAGITVPEYASDHYAVMATCKLLK